MDLLTRRSFLKNSFLSSVIFVAYSGELRAAVTPLQTIAVLHSDLFPKSLQTPPMQTINAAFYLQTIILNHTRIDEDTKTYIRDGIKWLNEESVSKYTKVYAKLSATQREKVLEDISEADWGESWLDSIMTYFLEAMLGDPVYSVNFDELGWKWLGHEGGFPRPKRAYL
ncbi:gluconate 2-dehydrogenase subunit 3 family protein [Sulfurimonas sp.]|nr:gluconate 2-dehydrogenase subunit 3 family protein [Sulfurimonas sp.]